MNHSFRRILLGLIMIVVCGALPQRSMAASAPGGSVTWGAPLRLTSFGARAAFPSSVIDRSGVLHIVFLGGDNLQYTNNAGGIFKNPTTLAAGLNGNKDPYFMVALGQDDSLHVVYAAPGDDNAVHYTRGTVSALGTVTWSTPEQVSGAGKAFAANIAVDAVGNAHITWIEKRGCSTYTAYYKERYANGTYGTDEQPVAGCDFQNQPRIAVTRDGTPHVFMVVDSGVVYVRRTATGWVKQTLNSAGANYNPTFTTDGVGLYAAWDGSGHDILFRRSRDGGQTWSNILNYADSSSFASFPSAGVAARAGRVYVAWADSFGNSDKGDTRIWYREFDPVTGVTGDAALDSPLAGPSTLPWVTTQGATAATVWQDKTEGGWRVAVTVGEVPCRSALATTSQVRQHPEDPTAYRYYVPIALRGPAATPIPSGSAC